MADYLKHQMPQRVATLFEQDYGALTPDEAIRRTYQQPCPNRWLAGFAPFVGRHIDVAYCQQLAWEGTEAFVVRNVLPLHPQPGEAVSLVGSVAWHLADTFRQVAALHDLTVGRIIQEPLQQLIRL